MDSEGRMPAGAQVPAAPRKRPSDDRPSGAPLLPAPPARPVAAPAGRAPPAAEPRLPENCKVLLKDLAEEMLTMNNERQMAEERAERAQRQLQRRLEAADVSGALAAERARAHAAEQEAEVQRKAAEDAQYEAEMAAAEARRLQQQLDQARQQVQEERRLREEAEARAAELERQLEAAAAQHAQPAAAQQQDMRRLGRAMIAGASGIQQQRQQRQQRQQQQQQPAQQERAQPRPLPPEQPAAAPHRAAEAAEAGGSGSQSGLSGTHSSEDDETFRDAVAAPAGAAAAAAAAAGAAAAPPPNVKQEHVAAAGQAPGQPAAMRPPPQRLGTLHGPVNPGKQAATRKRPAGGSLAAPAAARREAAAREGAPPAKQPRQELGGGGRQHPGHGSPGESALDALAALGSGLRRDGSGAAAGSGGSASPSSADGAPNLLLSLAGVGQEGWEDEEGGRRRGGRRSTSGVAGVVSLKPGETAQQWLNRSIVAYVGTLARERDFRPFEKPVPRSTPEYHRVIRQPMDLATIKIKAQQGKYGCPKAFKSDLMLVVNNAKRFNERPDHFVHKAADLLHDYLHKPHSFFTKVEAEFKQAETAAVLNQERAAQEAELEQEEERLAHSVAAGVNVAVYAEDDVNQNYYYLLRALGPVRKLKAEETDDFNITFSKGDEVIEGHYYDYWIGRDGFWDRSSGRRPYYLQDDRTALVPASSLLLVDIPLQERDETEMSPFDGAEHAIFDVAPDLHRQLKKAIKKFTAEPS